MKKTPDKQTEPKEPGLLQTALDITREVLEPAREPATEIVQSTMRSAAGALRFLRVSAGDTLTGMDRVIDDSTRPKPLGANAAKPQIMIESARRFFGSAYDMAIRGARQFEITEPADYSRLPKLMDDTDEDNRLKSDIIQRLGSRLDTKLNFKAEIDQLTRIAFELRIPPARLISFLMTDEVIGVMVDQAIGYHHSRRRTSSWLARVASTTESIETKLLVGAKKLEKKPIPQEVEVELIAKLEFFRDTFDPGDQKYTIVRLVEELSADYPDYDIPRFLQAHKNYLMDALKGRSTSVRMFSPKHIEAITLEGYKKCAGESEENALKFIEINLPQFFRVVKSAPDTADLPQGLEPGTSYVFIDTAKLQRFFKQYAATLRKAGLGPVRFRRTIMDLCETQCDGTGPDLVIKGGKKISHKKFSDFSELKAGLQDMITEETKHSGSHIDVVDLLSDPENVPPSLEEDFKLFFKEDGSFSDAYYTRVRNLFSLVLESSKGGKAKQETFHDIREKLSKVFEAINEYLIDYDTSQGLPPVAQVKEVMEENEYGNLVKIACTTDDPKVRAAACAKIQLAMLHFSIIYSPRYVFQDHDAKQIKLRLERLHNGLRIKRNDEGKLPLVKIKFIDEPGGKVYVLDYDPDEDDTELRKHFNVSDLHLVPVKFGGIDCYIMPVGVDGKGDPIDYAEVSELDLEDLQYIGKKDPKSSKTKILRREKYRAKDITDLIRMTFIAKTPEELFKLKEHIEREYLSFG
ncbi:hypothetical protein HY605_06060, partial [Candidatus Peregrinibacteria bacterium]|nr:hypothetical protein [Candidatus Peregrinibacteria bacterium]